MGRALAWGLLVVTVVGAGASCAPIADEGAGGPGSPPHGAMPGSTSGPPPGPGAAPIPTGSPDAGCTPRSCQEQGASCGRISDGCGHLVTCGICFGAQTCGGAGIPNVCGEPSCQPLSCAEMGLGCGAADDGCGRPLWCGSCAPDAGGSTGSGGLIISPGEAYLAPGAVLQLRATVDGGADAAVRWSIDEGSTGGELDSSGRYQAPANAGTFHLTATPDSGPSGAATAVIHTDSPLVDGHGRLLAGPTVYAIWWGPGSAFGRAPEELESFFSGLEGSSYLATLDQYLRGARASVRFGGSWFDSSAPPTGEEVAPMQEELCAQLAAHRAAPDPDGIYFLFTASAPSGPTAGFHWRASCRGVSITFAWVQNVEPGSQPACGHDAQTQFLAYVAAHELFEAMTDPDPYTGWNDPRMEEGEVSDKCELLAPQSCVSLANGSTWALPLQWSNAVRQCMPLPGGVSSLAGWAFEMPMR